MTKIHEIQHITLPKTQELPRVVQEFFHREQGL